MTKGLPNKVTGDWIESVCDVPDYLLVRAISNPPDSFVDFYDTFLALLNDDQEFKERVLDAWDGMIPANTQDFYQRLQGGRNWHEAFRQALIILTSKPLRKLGEAMGWEPSARFKIRELTKRHQFYIFGAARDAGGENEAMAMWHTVKLALTDLSGLISTETGEELKLGFSKVRVGNHTETLVSDRTMELLPPTLISEVVMAAREQMGITEQEAEQINFTPSSSSDSNVPRAVAEKAQTNETAPICAGTEESNSEGSE